MNTNIEAVDSSRLYWRKILKERKARRRRRVIAVRTGLVLTLSAFLVLVTVTGMMLLLGAAVADGATGIGLAVTGLPMFIAPVYILAQITTPKGKEESK